MSDIEKDEAKKLHKLTASGIEYFTDLLGTGDKDQSRCGKD